TVKFFKYVKGEYIVAFHEKASEKNERTEIGIQSGNAKVLFKQIAGYVARRIVCPIKEGDAVKIGDRCGMIKFGSRVDVLFPPGSEIRVKIGDVVKGGETIVGVIRS
ncbi:MAG TPA: phosphatidylserine decarboxylase, partial [Candidatus Kapabacteria bacterium]|nr:phosphatidylserine decarboxylase [Candidatus Kapabacteria bacterium]